ncbi:MAG: Hsp20/alpha crystallin family protein [Candidatus Eremiobacteraeota bacterium]|nr:Hsp20/alpha crystallin family protein [Candidatus Eremiobacteraeota bacterium]
MFELTRYFPRYEAMRMPDTFDRLFRETLPVMYRTMSPREAFKVPAIDLADRESHFLINAEVPGFKKEEIDISVDEDVLTIKGETRSEKEEKKENYFHREISTGSFSRSIKLPSEINREAIKASLKDGILIIEVPKIEQKEPEKKEPQKVPIEE